MTSDVLLNVKTHEYDVDKLPRPTGWHILVEPIDIEEKTAGGIILAEEHKKAKEYNRYVGKVIAMGVGCYRHPTFQQVGGDAWCELGDWVLYNQYTGMGANIRDINGEMVHLRFINDKAVIATAKDPRVFEIDL